MHDISDAQKKPSTSIPCLGCGQRDGLIAPINGKEAVLWCMRCGTLIDTESQPVDSLVPQLCVHTLSALGNQTFASQQMSKPAEDPVSSPQPLSSH